MRSTYSCILLFASLTFALPALPPIGTTKGRNVALVSEDIEERQIYRDNGGDYSALVPGDVDISGLEN